MSVRIDVGASIAESPFQAIASRASAQWRACSGPYSPIDTSPGGCLRQPDRQGTFDRDPVFVPELVLENFEGHNQDEIRPVLDCVWNAAGSPCSPNYDAQGRRKR